MHETHELSEKLAELRKLYPQGNPMQVETAMRAITNSMFAELTGKEAALLNEIEALAQTLTHTRAEIAALRADDITDSHIPSATDELDAIVAHTATATDNILECCETMDAIMPRLNAEDARTMQDVTTRIYEACSFQDITGQRITKVVSALKVIESKVAHMLDVFRREDWGKSSEPPKPLSGPEALLNGPQLPANAMDQSDIDALLASFD